MEYQSILRPFTELCENGGVEQEHSPGELFRGLVDDLSARSVAIFRKGEYGIEETASGH